MDKSSINKMDDNYFCSRIFKQLSRNLNLNDFCKFSHYVDVFNNSKAL